MPIIKKYYRRSNPSLYIREVAEVCATTAFSLFLTAAVVLFVGSA